MSDVEPTPATWSWLPALMRPLWVALTVLVVMVLLLGGSWWALQHEGPSARLLSVLPGVRVVGPTGAVLGNFSAQRIEVSLPRGSVLTLIEPRWRGLALRHDPDTAWHLGLVAETIEARSVDLQWVAAPAPKQAAPPPTQWDLPLSVRVATLKVGMLRSNLFAPQVLSGLEGQLDLQLGLRHRVVLKQLDVHGWVLHGEATMGTRQDMVLDLGLAARRESVASVATKSAGPDVASATLQLKGPLRHLIATGQVLIGEGAASPQRLTISGELTPFAAWPVPRLEAQAKRLDLGVLWPAWPQTALSGRVTVQPKVRTASKQRGAPDLTVDLALDNLDPGPWDAHRLPAQRLVGRVDLPVAQSGAKAGELASLGQAGQLAVTATLPRSMGRGTASAVVNGAWDLLTPQRTNLSADISGLEPQALDGRAPPLQLNGQINVRSAPAKAGQVGERWAVSADLSGLFGPVINPVKQAAQGRKTGQESTPGARPVALTLSGFWSPALAEVTSLSLRSGSALAKLTGRVDQPSGSAWRTHGQLDLTDFDPQLWMPWPALATGTHRLQGSMQFDVDATWHGEVQGRLDRSQLASVPLDGRWYWQAPAGRSDMNISLDLNAAGNHVSAVGTVPVVVRPGSGGAELSAERPQQWNIQAKAPALQALQPIALWWGWRDLQGQVRGDVTVTGVWPALTTQGQLEFISLQIKSPGDAVYAVAQAQGQWRVSTGSSLAPMEASVNISQARLGSMAIEQMTASLTGSAQSHRLVLQGDARLPRRAEVTSQANKSTPQPPSNSTTTTTTTTAQGVRLELALQGSVLETSRGWKGQVQRLSAVTVEPKPRTLLSAEAVDVSWATSPQDGLLKVSPTRVLVLGAALKIQDLQWHVPRQAGADGGQAEVAIDLEPLRLADALAHLQPQRGWGGDLVVAGQLRMRHSVQQPWQVDGQLARTAGDLTLSEPTIEGNSVQPLGIRQARIELKAREGVWTVSEQIEGRVLGAVTGQQTVQTRSRDSLPSADDPFSGLLNVKIGNLRPWGVWVPAGWRLSGQLEALAALTGTLGAPHYTGQVSGQNLGVAHSLQGINITDGQLLLDLQGDQARLTRLTAKGGEGGGNISVQGDAVLDAQPQAHLSLQADHFALLQRVDRRVVVSGQAKVTLNAEDILGDGRFVIDEGLIDITRADAPTIGDDVNVINRPGESPDAAEEAATASALPKRKLQATIDVDLGQKLRLKGRGLDAMLVGNVQLTTPNGRPAVRGVIRTASGSYVAYAQNLVIERGSVTFTGPIENPRLDILAMRAQSPLAASSEVKVGVTITGTAQDPRVRLYSDPNLSETEKLSWLVLGRGPAGLGGADIGLLQTAASALLSGEGGSPKDSVLSAIGLDDLSVSQSEGNVRGTVVNVGKQISRKWYVGYERSLNATTGNWQLIYRLAQRFTVRAQTGQDNALDLIWSWRFD
ncbi:MAG: translocation/assembly module TamB domain-containing protein [Burkholderiales bacterium]|nr:translocation/assembly module TamB domain-containing protein [Burkholderiales bacterium]